MINFLTLLNIKERPLSRILHTVASAAAMAPEPTRTFRCCVARLEISKPSGWSFNA